MWRAAEVFEDSYWLQFIQSSWRWKQKAGYKMPGLLNYVSMVALCTEKAGICRRLPENLRSKANEFVKVGYIL